MKCRTVQKKLSAYQDRELKPREQEEVDRHLLSCRACREQYEELGRVWQSLGGLEGIRPDPWFYRQLVRKIKEPREKGVLLPLQHVFRLLRGPAIASIILVAGLLAGTYLGGVLARFDLSLFQTNRATYSQEAFFASLKVFDPAPPGTFAEGYLRIVAHKESDSR
jgi:predicted anti-sigma-YlaC factor YlaD